MNKKQVWGLVVAAIIFVVVGIIGVVTNVVSGSFETASTIFEDGTYGYDTPVAEDYVAVLDISGTIQASPEDTGVFAAATTGYDHDTLMSYVDRLMDDPNNKGIVLTLDTPGGTVYESDEFYLKLMEYKEKTGNPIYSYMESMCCSGGYYIAAASNEMYANRNTWTGSIGVIISSYNYAGLFDKIGVEEVNIVSGDNKAMGHPGEKMTPEQEAIFQGLVDEAYEQFVDVAAKGRNMDVAKMKELADGRVYTAKQATENGLIDGIKSEEEFMDYVQGAVGEDVTIYTPTAYSTDYFSQLFGMAKSTGSLTELQLIQQLMEKEGSGVPMYVYSGQ